MGVNSPVRDCRTRFILIAVTLTLLSGVDLRAGETQDTRSYDRFWSLGAVQQRGPGDDTFYGLRALYVVNNDDEGCGMPMLLFFGGGELLAAPEGRIARVLGSFSLLSIPFGPPFHDFGDRRRLSFWLWPSASIDWLWDVPDGGTGVAVGFGAEIIFRPSVRTQLGLGWDRSFSTVLGSRNQLSLSFRWGIRERKPSPVTDRL